ncbi:MAG TPA: hypothetical protein VF625_12235 [Longimicrobium sp.]
MKLVRGTVLALLAAVVLGGCKSDGDSGQGPGAAAIDTTNDNALDGLSTQQVQREAQAVSPDQADQQGLVDSTIHLENLSSSDSAPPGASTPNPARPGTPAAARGDTASPLPETKPGVTPRP